MMNQPKNVVPGSQSYPIPHRVKGHSLLIFVLLGIITYTVPASGLSPQQCCNGHVNPAPAPMALAPFQSGGVWYKSSGGALPPPLQAFPQQFLLLRGPNAAHHLTCQNQPAPQAPLPAPVPDHFTVMLGRNDFSNGVRQCLHRVRDAAGGWHNVAPLAAALRNNAWRFTNNHCRYHLSNPAGGPLGFIGNAGQEQCVINVPGPAGAVLAGAVLVGAPICDVRVPFVPAVPPAAYGNAINGAIGNALVGAIGANLQGMPPNPLPIAYQHRIHGLPAPGPLSFAARYPDALDCMIAYFRHRLQQQLNVAQANCNWLLQNC